MTRRALVLLNVLIALILSAEFAAPYYRQPDIGSALPNSCEIEARSYQCSLLAGERVGHCSWSRLIGVTCFYWFARPSGHALLAYDIGSGRIQVYDVNSGTYQLKTGSHDLTAIAKGIHGHDRHMAFARWLN